MTDPGQRNRWDGPTAEINPERARPRFTVHGPAAGSESHADRMRRLDDQYVNRRDRSDTVIEPQGEPTATPVPGPWDRTDWLLLGVMTVGIVLIIVIGIGDYWLYQLGEAMNMSAP